MKTPYESVELTLLNNALAEAKAAKKSTRYKSPYVAKRQITARVGVFGVLVESPRPKNRGPMCLVECHYGPGFQTRRQASRSARQLANVARALLNGKMVNGHRRTNPKGKIADLEATVRWLSVDLRVPARLQAKFKRALIKAFRKEKPKSGLTDNFARTVLASLTK